jgi:hypothetical protein
MLQSFQHRIYYLLVSGVGNISSTRLIGSNKLLLDTFYKGLHYKPIADQSESPHPYLDGLPTYREMANENGNTFAFLDCQLRSFNSPDLLGHEFVHHVLEPLCLELHDVCEEYSFGILLFDHDLFACRHHTEDLSEIGER